MLPLHVPGSAWKLHRIMHTMADVTEDPEWPGELALAFHSQEWRELVHDVYGFEALPVEGPGASLPLFHTRSPLLGSRLTTAVFNGYAGPLAATDGARDEVIAEAVARACARRVDYLELRCLAPLSDATVERNGLLRRAPYRHSLLELGPYAEVEGRYDRKFRKNLRQARRRIAAAGVQIERSDDLRELERFHRLLVRRYRDRHAMIAQPFSLFAALRRRFLLANRGDLWVARDPAGQLLGGLVFLTHQGTVTGAYGAVDAVDPRWSLDSVMKDETIRHYATAGFRVYDLGLSSPTQHGLLQAKSRFGGVTLATPWYYRLVRAKQPPSLDFANSYRWLRRPFQFLPVAAIQRLSPFLVRWLG